MLKALAKKQFLELNQSYFYNKKTGKNRGKAGTAAFVALFVLIFIGVGFMFYGLATTLLPLSGAGLDWLYFALMGLISLALGVFGSAFNTYAGLYKAKDNEMLLSMPIPPAKILLVRMIGVYAMSLLYEALVFIPTVIAWWGYAERVTALTVIMDVLCVFLLGLVVMTLTCALGWVIAMISGRLRNKSFVTVAFSLLFIALYYLVYFRVMKVFNNILVYADAAATGLRRWVFPVYAFGQGCAGDLGGWAVFALLALALFAICYLLMSRNFLKLLTTNRGEKKAAYRETAARVEALPKALLRKELLRFKSSSTYMMNCGLGVILLPAIGVVFLIRQEALRDALANILLEMPEMEGMIPVVAVAVVCLMSSLNCVTAPSVSLEGKGLWLLQTMPVEPLLIFQAKEKLHLLISAAPAAIAAVALCIALRLEYSLCIYVVVLCLLFVKMTGAFGLIVNLLKPTLSWTSEVVPIKQSASVILCLFGGWLLAAVMAAGYYFLRNSIAGEQYLLIWIVIMALLVRWMESWLRTKGTKIFERLC